ncbi:hypothetical protein ACHAXN_009131 [Cyclotella atomus]
MPSVSDELAALRSKGTVKQHADALKSKSGGALSTPEAEEASLAKLKKEDKVKKAQAEELLRKTNAAGGGLVEEELKKVGDRKKMFEKGRVEAKTLLAKGANSGRVGRADVSSGSVEKSEKAAELLETAPATVAAAETVEVKDSSSDDIVPEVEEMSPQDVPNLDDDDVPDLEEAEAQGEPSIASSTSAHTTNRNEKKVRKLMSRLDMRPVPGIARAVMKTASCNFFIEQPDVFVSGKNNEVYVIFGEARQQQSPLANLSRQQAVETIRQSSAPVEESMETSQVMEEEVNEEGLEAKDIELVMAQASVEKSVAVKALRENDGDLVNAIMSLTT